MSAPEEIDEGEAAPPVEHSAAADVDLEAGKSASAPTIPDLDLAPPSTAAFDTSAPAIPAQATDPHGDSASKDVATDASASPKTSAPTNDAATKPPSQSIAAKATNADVLPEARVARHWPLMVMVFVLIAGAGLLVVFTALPAVARELGWTHARTVSRTTRRSLSAGHAGVDAVNERERKLALEGADDDDDSPLQKGAQIAVSMQQTTLFKGPAASSGPVGSIERGERLVVVREDHGFYMVVHRGPAGTDVGWVRKSDVLAH